MKRVNLTIEKIKLPIYLFYLLILQVNSIIFAKYFILIISIIISLEFSKYKFSTKYDVKKNLYLFIISIFIVLYPLLALDDIHKFRDQINIALIAVFSMIYGFYIGSGDWENFSLKWIKFLLIIATLFLITNQIKSIFFNENINRLTTTHISIFIFVINSYILFRYKKLFFCSIIYLSIYILAVINNSKNFLIISIFNLIFFYIFSKKKINSLSSISIPVIPIFLFLYIHYEFNLPVLFHNLLEIFQYQYDSVTSGQGLLNYENFYNLKVSHSFFTRVSYFFEALFLIFKFPFGFGMIGNSFEYAQIVDGINNIAPGQAHSAILDLALCYGVFIVAILFGPFVLLISKYKSYNIGNFRVLIILAFNFLALLILTESSYGLFFGYILSLYGFLIGGISRK